VAYVKTTWVQGQLPAANAVALNKMEQGIADAHALPWTNVPALAANWSGNGAEQIPQYAKLSSGLIVLRGLAVLTAAGFTATIATFPAASGLRPAKTERWIAPTFAATAGVWGAAYIGLNTDGTLTHNVQISGTAPAGTGSWLSLAGLFFTGDGG
jgi:hypothetical protein